MKREKKREIHYRGQGGRGEAKFVTNDEEQTVCIGCD